MLLMHWEELVLVFIDLWKIREHLRPLVRVLKQIGHYKVVVLNHRVVQDMQVAVQLRHLHFLFFDLVRQGLLYVLGRLLWAFNLGDVGLVATDEVGANLAGVEFILGVGHELFLADKHGVGEHLFLCGHGGAGIAEES